LACRTEKALDKDLRKKLALFCNVDLKSIIEVMDAETIYDVPLLLLKEKLDTNVIEKLKLPVKTEPQLADWKNFLGKLKTPTEAVEIALVGKYVSLHDAYKSIAEAFIHAGASNECRVSIRWVNSEIIDEESVATHLKDIDAVLVAPGFGHRGIQGKIDAIKYVRENNIPFLGICLGMQCAVVDFARNVLHLNNAHSTEINPETPHAVIDLMSDQKNVTDMGGTMRLGAYPCSIVRNSLAENIYSANIISERHRHRYEFNNTYLSDFEKAGMRATGVNPNTGLVEIVEIPSLSFFVGVQFHPELKSTALNPHPLFVRFVKEAIAMKYRRIKS
jgi:CTP synthase